MEQRYPSLESNKDELHSGDQNSTDTDKETRAMTVQANTQQAVPNPVRFLLAEHTLSAPLATNSLLELRKAFRASYANTPAPTCHPPLDACILQSWNSTVRSSSSSQNAAAILAHILISVESFLASLSLLDDLQDRAESCPSVPALFCDTILRQDPYRDHNDISLARHIMEHIDAHHESISYEVNLELGSTHIRDRLPALSDNQCRCPLQRLEMLSIYNRSGALAEAAYLRLTEVEDFNAFKGLSNPLLAAKYFHSFELRIKQLVLLSNSFNVGAHLAQYSLSHLTLPRVRRSQANDTYRSQSKL
jgi:hypothetical protein